MPGTLEPISRTRYLPSSRLVTAGPTAGTASDCTAQRTRRRIAASARHCRDPRRRVRSTSEQRDVPAESCPSAQQRLEPGRDLDSAWRACAAPRRRTAELARCDTRPPIAEPRRGPAQRAADRPDRPAHARGRLPPEQNGQACQRESKSALIGIFCAYPMFHVKHHNGNDQGRESAIAASASAE